MLATVEKAGEQQPTRGTAAATEVDFNRERADSKTSSPQANASTPTPQANKITSISETNKSLSSLQTSARSSSPSSTWPPTKCTPLCNERCSYAGKHHELIMAMMKCSNGSEIDKTDFKKSLDKFAKTKWLRSGCIPDRDEKLRLPLVHWACMLGKYKALEYLVSEKGFELTTKVGKSQHGPLHSMVQHLNSCLNPKSSKEYVSNMFGNIVDVFLKYTIDVLCEKDPSTGDTILHFLAKRCCSDIFSRMYLKTLLVKIKENAKVSQEKLYEILSAVNKRGDTFLHVIVPDEESVPTLNYFFGNFGLNSEKISKAKNNFGKTPRQIAVEKRSFQMLKALGAPDVVISSLQKAVAGGKSNTSTPKRVRFIDEKDAKKSPSKTSPATKSSSEDNAKLEDKEASNHCSAIVDLTTQEKSTVGASSGEQQGGENLHVSSDQLQTDVLKLCSCDSPNDEKGKATNSSAPTKRTIEPFPQRNPGNEKGNKTSPGKSVGAVEKAGEVAEVIDIPEDMPEAPTNSSDSNIFLSLSNTVNSLKKGDSLSTSRKRPALTTLKSKAPRRKRGRGSWSDSESDVEDEEDFNLDDDSDDDVESEEEDLEEEEEMDEEEVDKEEAESVSSAGKKAAEIRNEDDIELETAPKHTPFCSQDCSSQHHKLLLSLLKCSNYNYGMEHNNTFMKQVNDYINQHGKFSDVRANADLPDPMPPFQYPLVHWVCVLGKYKVLERLTELKEFNFAVQSERTGETGLHRMLLSLDRAMVALKKSSVKTILDVFSKTLRTLTDNAPIVLTLSNKEGDTPFHCTAKVILDCTGENMNTYEGYFEHLMKELARLRVSGKLSSDAARELLLKTNNSQETFLHILACRHGVGQRVIKRVLKNIEPEIMDLLKEIKDANDKTASDLAEDLCSYEMAAILRPRDQEAGPPDWVDDAAEDLPQTPDSGTPRETPDIQSPPPTLFPSSPVFPDVDAARVRLFAVKKEPGVDDTEFDETTSEDPVEVNSSSSSLQTAEDAVKKEPNVDDSEDPPEINSSPTTSQTTEDVQIPAVNTSPNHANSSPTRPTKEDVNAIASASGSSESSVGAATVNHNISSNMPALPVVPGTSRKSAGTPTTSQSPNGAASHSSSVLADHSKNSSKGPSIISKISKFKNLPQTDKLLNTLHAKFQEQLAQSEKGLGEKEDALVRVLHRMTEAQERRQKLQQELEENLNEMLAIKQEEGLLRSEIAVQKRDCEKFKAELEKYAGIREQEK